MQADIDWGEMQPRLQPAFIPFSEESHLEYQTVGRKEGDKAARKARAIRIEEVPVAPVLLKIYHISWSYFYRLYFHRLQNLLVAKLISCKTRRWQFYLTAIPYVTGLQRSRLIDYVVLWRRRRRWKGVLYTNSRASRQGASGGLANSRKQYETVRVRSVPWHLIYFSTSNYL